MSVSNQSTNADFWSIIVYCARREAFELATQQTR